MLSPLRLELSIMLISYYIMVISKMAAKMAAVTLKLAYLLNYLLQISREGIYHWVFWRHISLYQIKVHILVRSSKNPRWLPVYKHWYILYTIQSWKKRVTTCHQAVSENRDPWLPKSTVKKKLNTTMQGQPSLLPD